MNPYFNIYTQALKKTAYLIAFVLSAQFCFAQTTQTIDFSKITPTEEKDLYELYINNHLSPEKLTPEQKKAWDAKIEKESKTQTEEINQPKQGEMEKLNREENKNNILNNPSNQNDNNNNNININEDSRYEESESKYEKMQTIEEEAQEVEKMKGKEYQKKLTEMKQTPK